MILVSKVTAPFRARARPSIVAPVVIEIDVSAMMLPLNTEFVPSVAELPTCQKMHWAWAPPVSTIWRPASVMSVDPIWKMKVWLGSPPASSVRSPDEIASDDVEL